VLRLLYFFISSFSFFFIADVARRGFFASEQFFAPINRRFVCLPSFMRRPLHF